MILAILNLLLFAQATGPAAPQSAPAPSITQPASERVVYEISRLRNYDDERLPAALITAAVIALVAVVWYLYRRDTLELARAPRFSIVLLRLIALAGLFVFFLGIERRTTREVVHNSQVAVLVDVSQSMGLGEHENATETGGTRIQAVVNALANGLLVTDLRQSHDVNVARFERDVEPVVSMPKKDEPVDAATTETSPATTPQQKEKTIDWSAVLQPRGTETRLGQALADELRLYHDAPLAGIVVMSDGAQNAGIEPSAAIETARQAGVPFYAIGFGSATAQRNIALRDLVVPTRAFPHDTLNIAGYLQASGYAGQSVDVELTRRRSQDKGGAGTPVATKHVSLGPDGEMVPVSFDLEPSEPGTFVFKLRVKAPPDDGNPRDNEREAEVEVVDRKTRVLLFASGPMRDYQFLRNQLHRDNSMIVDVLLQTAQTGISQDANTILDHFPSTPEELYQYDCIVAFDPDWTKLDAAQVELVEKWISEEAGGLIAVAGPIQTPRWIRSTEQAKLRDLYPVEFQHRITLMDDAQYSGQNPWPLTLERAGREAKFLWLGKTAEESEAAWDNFPGVYGFYGVKGEKPGATVYARFSDPQAGAGQRPVYLASHFYGAGQVFYIGSGELWRLRGSDPAYFEVLYTKLIRHVSQGRILRGSSRGSLLVERDRYELGEAVVVRARLSDAQHKPLTDPSVGAQLLRPDGSSEPVKLTAVADKPGMYIGQATVMQEGTYQLALAVPGGNEEPLSKYIQVRVPDRERTHAERNDALLASITKETGGIYYRELETAIRGDNVTPPLSQAIKSRAEIKLVKGAPDKDFARAQMSWLLGIIAGSLFIEWIVRRLNRLA
jgi:von Willebrand factor type A domain